MNVCYWGLSTINVVRLYIFYIPNPWSRPDISQVADVSRIPCKRNATGFLYFENGRNGDEIIRCISKMYPSGVTTRCVSAAYPRLYAKSGCSKK